MDAAELPARPETLDQLVAQIEVQHASMPRRLREIGSFVLGHPEAIALSTLAELAAETAIQWWKDRGEDPTQKLVIFSDGLDTDEIQTLYRRFTDRVKVSFGWGTNLTNDFRGLVPDAGLEAFSLVCKAVSANGNPTVKLSDNPNKAMGPKEEIERYKRVFDVGQQLAVDVTV